MGNDLLKGKVCLVTGATKGIGKAITELFVREGAIVYGCGRDAEGFAEEVLPLCFDITDSDAMKNAVMQIKREQGKIDVLVNNAGVVSNELLGTVSKEHLRNMFEVNVFAAFELMQLVGSKIMCRQKSGSIINITSMVAQNGCAGQVAYSASKGALISMTKSAAKEWAGKQIRVNAVAPGMTGTERIMKTIEEQYKGEIPTIGMQRLATPEDIANACLFFASDMSSYVTGEVLGVNGAMII